MADFDAKLSRRHRNDWSGQRIEVQVFEDGEKVFRIDIGRRDAYTAGDPSEYEVKVVNATGEEHIEVTLMHLHSADVWVATR